LTIEERMKRNEPEDKIYIGQLVEQHLRSEFGQIVKCIIEGVKDRKLDDSERNPNISSDRILGIIVGLTALQTELDSCVFIARSLKEEKRIEHEVK